MKRLILLLLFTASAWAQPLEVQTSQNAGSTLRPLTTQQQATVWGVTPEEWQRYLTLKQQARGVWSPGLDPLTTLGVEAESDHERQRFAELLVRQEYRRLEKELAFQRAYDAAWQRLYPGLTPLKTTSASTSRVSLFVQEDCPPCDSLLRTLLAQQRPLDIWLVGSEGDDNRVRRWAMAHGIDALFIDYARIVLPRHNARAWEVVAQLAERVNDKNTPRPMLGRDPHVVALEQYLNAEKFYDPILDGLLSAVRYDKTYFDKIVASLLPLLEKLTTGTLAALLAPDYHDLDDARPILDWQQAIRQKAVVYVGLDALSDVVVAAAVGNSMFADLVSVTEHLYKFGLNDGLPGNSEKPLPINLHCDEFNELMGEEFIPLVNKGGGAGIQVTAYTQTLSDIQARIGSAPKTGQVVGNFNNLIMLRVRETATAELLTKQLPQVEVRSRQVSSGVTDTPGGINSFTSNTREQVITSNVPLIDTAALIQLPKGQTFALLEGGQLWKIRLPLPVADKHCPLPESVAQLAAWMQARQQGRAE
ncbi:TIGR03759 family integrating conjugative element protein [Salmonella enterica]|uniref:TIGR03759 family integrating conjugative element protein n=3 Tax=Salmonella enterica TaxID=28901 RepID=UPI0026DAB8F6|nr:TIGR03759 family integrating conjugative element protein [Salmonella enterica]MDO3870727.1 TIGR03759 family integrating conjugative element protein [Salmonella enterica]MDO3884285.1 TIGR03759 family integrating conjugative element protein [Salmonella enterica]MDO3897477.1 TIGR03759 family integrating conjugative element protein [Salmonella enterica]MDO3974310.1 TIGR03759 family integrating conjugative element protein [Salmonella enterica]